MSETEEIMSACSLCLHDSLCPRDCHVDRNAGKKGFCGEDKTVYLARAALHMWEEPCISGKKGSGAVFFSGCGLRCCFCQNLIIFIILVENNLILCGKSFSLENIVVFSFICLL